MSKPRMRCHNICIGVPCGYPSKHSDSRCAGCERLKEVFDQRPLTMTPEKENNGVVTPGNASKRYRRDDWVVVDGKLQPTKWRSAEIMRKAADLEGK